MTTNLEILESLKQSENKDRKILEIGTKRSNPEVAANRKHLFQDYQQYIMTDFQEGMDVDVVSNIESLSDVFEENYFDVVLAFSVFEHVQKVWLAPEQIFRVLKPGGIVYVQTHQTFPIHSYPSDYWRFTTEAMRTLFDETKFKNVISDYQYPCEINSDRLGSSKGHSAFLNVNLSAQKI